MKSVEGTDSERAQFQTKFQSLRFYHGPAMLFWTLSPRDSESPLTIRYMAHDVWKHHRVPLDIDELAVHEFWTTLWPHASVFTPLYA